MYSVMLKDVKHEKIMIISSLIGPVCLSTLVLFYSGFQHRIWSPA